ncbi:MAG: PhoH family protein [Halobacteria archaeon]
MSKKSAKRQRKAKFQPPQEQYFQPRNPEQQQLQDAIVNNSITIASGCAGSGKTLFAIQTLYDLYKGGILDSLKVVRLITETFGENLGALPGERREKLDDYLGPIKDNLLQVIPAGELNEMVEKEKIEVLPVSRLRGRSFTRAGVILEEFQNLSEEMALLCLTRIGQGSKFVVTGDPSQVDFYGRNGIRYAERLCEGLEDTEVVKFSEEQVERHPVIKKLVQRARFLNYESDRSPKANDPR